MKKIWTQKWVLFPPMIYTSKTEKRKDIVFHTGFAEWVLVTDWNRIGYPLLDLLEITLHYWFWVMNTNKFEKIKLWK